MRKNGRARGSHHGREHQACGSTTSARCETLEVKATISFVLKRHTPNSKQASIMAHIVDTALEKRFAEGNPVRVGLVGAGFMAKGLVLQIEKVRAVNRCACHLSVRTRIGRHLVRRAFASTVADVEPWLL